MDLQEDAYRLQQVLRSVSYKELVKFLRSQTPEPNCDVDIRCQTALQHFLTQEHELATTKPLYKEHLKADFKCLKHLLVTVPSDKIEKMLEVLGPIPQRKLVAAKLLLHEENGQNANNRKRKSEEENNEATSSKLAKVADSTNSVELPSGPRAINGNSKIPKLVLKRDGNANEFMVSAKNRSKSESPPPVRFFSSPREISEAPTLGAVAEKTIQPNEVAKEPLPSASVANPALDVQPGPSGKGLIRLQPAPNHSDDDWSDDSDATDYDFPLLKDVAVKPEATVEPTVVTEPTSPVETPLPVDEKLVLKIMEMFPDALPQYIRKVCAGKNCSQESYSAVVEVILSEENYPRRPDRQPSPEHEVDPEEQLNMIKQLLPDADPTFLQKKVDEYAGNHEALRVFIDDTLENKNYPTLKDYLRKQKLSAQQRQYTTEFDVERFLELFPDPVSVFEDLTRKSTIIDSSDRYYVKCFMRNKYSRLYAKDVNNIVDSKGTINIISIVKDLDQCLSKGCLKKTKGNPYARPDSQNIPLLQELAYFEHKQKILKHLEMKKTQLAEEKANAKQLGLLQTCSCCFDDEVMPCDILTCTGGCRFCKECIRRSTEVAFGEGKTDFRCLSGDCEAQFSLQVLKDALTPNMFSILAQKKAVAEVKAAGVEDLEMCPFCDFANIPAPEDKLFRCLNPDCMKESCRLCKESSHVPLRCEEVEKDQDVKARTYIENKMTEALVRECWKCGAKFIKEEGCNKMTCSCGALMCYICRQPVKDYTHFNGQGGDRFHLCPLYSDNFSVNEKNVLKAAEEAKKSVDPAKLKNDPTADLEKHFATKRKESVKRQERIVDGMIQRLRDGNVDAAVVQQLIRHHRARHGENPALPGEGGWLAAPRARVDFHNIRQVNPPALVNPAPYPLIHPPPPQLPAQQPMGHQVGGGVIHNPDILPRPAAPAGLVVRGCRPGPPNPTQR